MKTVMLAILWIIIIPGTIGYAWDEWKRHDAAECAKSRECKKRQAEIDKYVVDREMPDEANQNYYRY